MVEAILDATTRVLKERGYKSLTTNHIAEVAGVSVGSLYQYFPNKSSLLKALHTRHSEEMADAIRRVLSAGETNDLQGDVRRLIRAAVAAHEADPQLHRILEEQLPVFEEDEKAGSEIFEHILMLISKHLGSCRPDIQMIAWTVMRLTGSLVHAAILHPPAFSSLEAMESEIADVVYNYLKLKSAR